MALKNLIHASNNINEICANINSLFTETELQDIKEQNPELYELVLEYRRRTEKSKEITPR